MHTKCEFAIVMLTYNQRNYVRDAVMSILQQECRPIDIMISDDSSNDGTFEVIERAVSSYQGPHRVQLVRNSKNLGLIPHLNRCLERCAADYVIGAAGDDISVSSRAERVIQTFKRTDALLVHSQVDVIAPEEDKAEEIERLSEALFFRTTSLLEAATSSSLYIGATAAWNMALFRKYGPIIESDVYEDLIIGFRAALEGRVAFIDEPLVKYRVHTGMSSPINDDRTRAFRHSVLERQKNVLNQRLKDIKIAEKPHLEKLIVLERDTIEQQMLLQRSAPKFLMESPLHPLRSLTALRREWNR